MIDAKTILDDLKEQARTASEELNLEDAINDVSSAAEKVKDRIESDPNAKAAAVGVGGFLLAGLLGTQNGRNFVGSLAKTGAVAALGALAYKAWRERGSEETPEPDQLSSAGFPIDPHTDPTFSLAVVKIMIAAALADGRIDKYEQAFIDAAFERSGISKEAQKEYIDEFDLPAAIDEAVDAARSPNHAAELYAAAVVVASDLEKDEAAFLERLAGRLGINSDYAARIRFQALS
ncbi:MAG: DUF533 domain-containing protein [Pseudomonadota bacterium]